MWLWLDGLLMIAYRTVKAGQCKAIPVRTGPRPRKVPLWWPHYHQPLHQRPCHHYPFRRPHLQLPRRQRQLRPAWPGPPPQLRLPLVWCSDNCRAASSRPACIGRWTTWWCWGWSWSCRWHSLRPCQPLLGRDPALRGCCSACWLAGFWFSGSGSGCGFRSRSSVRPSVSLSEVGGRVIHVQVWRSSLKNRYINAFLSVFWFFVKNPPWKRRRWWKVITKFKAYCLLFESRGINALRSGKNSLLQKLVVGSPKKTTRNTHTAHTKCRCFL